jgi:hypothetical protein
VNGTAHVKAFRMRTSIAFAIAAVAAAFVTGCASTPTHVAAATDAPMYSASEWTAMNSESTVGEFPDAVASNEQAGGSGASLTGYSGSFGAFDNYSSGPFRSYGGGNAVHGAIAGTAGGFSGGGFSGGGFSAGHAGVSSAGHASGGGHASSGGHGGHGGH